jgi:hypothetical protein
MGADGDLFLLYAMNIDGQLIVGDKDGEFPAPVGPGLFEGCDWKCGTATVVTAGLGWTVTGGICSFTLGFGFGCGASATVTVGLTSVVYESTSNPGTESFGQLACAFVFGPSSSGGNAAMVVFSAGLGGATQGRTSAAASVAKDVGSEITQAVSGVC